MYQSNRNRGLSIPTEAKKKKSLKSALQISCCRDLQQNTLILHETYKIPPYTLASGKSRIRATKATTY